MNTLEFAKGKVNIVYQNEAVRLEVLDEKNNTFKALCDSSVKVTVKYNNEVLNENNGVYTVNCLTDNESLFVTTEGESAAQNHKPDEGINGEDLTCYNREVYGSNFWEGETTYHEAVLFADTPDGIKLFEKSLLFPIDDVISIRSSDLKTWYVKGVDFEITKEGKLIRTENSKIPLFDTELRTLRSDSKILDDPMVMKGNCNTITDYFFIDDDYGLTIFGDGYHEKFTVYVTYTHTKTWSDAGIEGFTPITVKKQGNKFAELYEKLAAGDDLNILVYGDSCATGAASSGELMNYYVFDKSNKPLPLSEGTRAKIPTFFEQSTDAIIENYGNNNKVSYYNIALGGMGASWCKENVKQRVEMLNNFYANSEKHITDIVPDIIYIKCFANDCSTPTESYKESFLSMISQFEEIYPNAFFVLVSGKINNERSVRFKNRQLVLEHEAVLEEIAENNPKCIVAKVTSAFAEIIKSKDQEDYLSNNINHSNDFWATIVAQIIAASAEIC